VRAFGPDKKPQFLERHCPWPVGLSGWEHASGIVSPRAFGELLFFIAGALARGLFLIAGFEALFFSIVFRRRTVSSNWPVLKLVDALDLRSV
jgi:hypothetical protein